ncbi:hypothetical protein V866_004806 [Kwoniella sp. B9012]
MKEIESRLMEKLQLKTEEDKEDVEKEINKRLLSIKNATQDAISQIRRCKVDTKKEDIKLSLWYQSIEKAQKDSLGVIKREKQDLEEVKNRRIGEINTTIRSGIETIEKLGNQLMRELRETSSNSMVDLETTGFRLGIEQERAMFKIDEGDYVICGTYTKEELLQILDPQLHLIRSRSKKSKKNKNIKRNQKNRQVEIGNNQYPIRNHMLNDPDYPDKLVNLDTYLHMNPGPSAAEW